MRLLYENGFNLKNAKILSSDKGLSARQILLRVIASDRI